MFAQLSLRGRLALIVISAVIGMVVIALLGAFGARQALQDSHREQVKTGVQAIHNLVSYYQEQEVAGKLSRDEAQKLAADAIRQARYGGPDGKTEYYYAWTLAGVGVAHIKREVEGQNMLDKLPGLKDVVGSVANSDDAFLSTTFTRPGGDTPVPKLVYVKKFAPWNWLIGTGIYLDSEAALFRERLLAQLAVALLPILLTGLLTYFVARSVIGQIGGEPADAVAVMTRVAGGDLTARVGDARPGSLLHALGGMTASLSEILRQISLDARNVVANSELIARTSQEVSAASEQQVDATSSMAAAIEQLTVSSNHISDNASQTEQFSTDAVQLSGQGTDRVKKATQAIQQIAQTVAGASNSIQALDNQANQISSIASVIKDIAGQTNLLALNAAIEAARAGEQGRGFAVVADEVRKLAERTASATTEIEQMITGIQHETITSVHAINAVLPEVNQGVQLATSAVDSLAGIETGAHETLERIREVANATREQSSASTSIAQRVELFSRMVEETNHRMNTMTGSARELEQIAVSLEKIVSRFRT